MKSGKGPRADELASMFFEYLEQHYKISREDIEASFSIEKGQILIPVSIFTNRTLGPFEAVVKYLRENQKFSIKRISELTNRSSSTVGVTYYNAKSKQESAFGTASFESSEYWIPADKIADRKFSVLESLVKWLVEQQGLTYHKIAVLLNRDDRTIWTAQNRARRKKDA